MKCFFVFCLTSIFLFACNAQTDIPWQDKAEQFFNNNQYNEAVEFLEDQLFINPDNQEMHYYLGQAYKVLACGDGSRMNEIITDYALKSVVHFKRVIEISPEYKGREFVVGPYSKLQSEWGSLAFKYLYEGKVDSTDWAFRTAQSDGAFFPSIMEYNKNIMASCQPNAILFTNGDNDTFPMWFLQIIVGYRTDITVINLSLLNVPWYIKQLKNNYPTGANNLQLNFNDDEIDSLKPILWEERKVSVRVDDPLNINGKIEWIFKPTIEDRAIRIQDIMVKHIIESNNWVRPIYFSATVSEINKIGLQDYLSIEGIVYKLESHNQILNSEQLEKNLMETYTFSTIDEYHVKNVNEIKSLFANYYFCFARLAYYYIDEGNKEKAKSVVVEMDIKIPEGKVPFTSNKMKSAIRDLRKEISEQKY